MDELEDEVIRVSWVLLGITAVLVIGGCILYAYELVGWAQMLWVLASGTAGAGCAVILEERDRG